MFNNRVRWANTHLKRAGLLESPRRGIFRITSRGKSLLSKGHKAINVDMLRQFPGYAWLKKAKTESVEDDTVIDATGERTPEESIELGYQKIKQELEADLLSRIKSSSSVFFEKLVVKLLVKMGYGGSLYDAGTAIGKSGDGGIDGIIKEDKLGLDIVYVQAKRWDNGSVGRPEVQKFAGALQGQRARKGVFLTTSSFTKDAQDYVSLIDSKIVLIDGQHLAQLMIDHNVGVSTVSTYEIKKIDSDYFTEE